MTPTSSARKADQEATMTQDADAGGRERPKIAGEGYYELLTEKWALEARLAAAETARREAEQERDRLQRVHAEAINFLETAEAGYQLAGDVFAASSYLRNGVHAALKSLTPTHESEAT